MISFFSRASYTTSAMRFYASSEGYQMMLPGPIVLGSIAQQCVRQWRAPSDFIQTSSATYFAGDRTCKNQQAVGSFIQDPSNVTGIPGLRPFDYADFCSTQMKGYPWIIPEDHFSYSDAEIRSGPKTFAWAPMSPFMVGTAPYANVVIMPGCSAHYRRVRVTSNGYSSLEDTLISYETAGGFTIGLVELYSLSRRYGQPTWTKAGYSASVLVLARSTPDRSNMVFGLTPTGVTPYGSTVPVELYPGGVPPSSAYVLDLQAQLACDPFGFKALMASRVGMLTPATPKSPVSVGYENVDVEAAKALLTPLFNDALDSLATARSRDISEYDWGDMANTCVDNCRCIDINGIAYVKEAVTGIWSILKFIKTGDIPDASPADLWLSARYGLRLTLSDSAAIASAAKDAVKQASRPFSVAHARKSFSVPSRLPSVTHIDCKLSYKVYYNRRDDPAIKVMRTIADWDLWPSAKNIWDLIPLSFVVDWFVDVQSQLEHIDASQYEQFLSIRSILYSERWAYTFDPGFFRIPGWTCNEMEMTYYHRRHSPFLHYAPLRFGGGHASNINWIDGATLIIQRSSK